MTKHGNYGSSVLISKRSPVPSSGTNITWNDDDEKNSQPLVEPKFATKSIKGNVIKNQTTPQAKCPRLGITKSHHMGMIRLLTKE